MKRSVIVTGGVSRLGAVIATHLETLGWRVLRSSHRYDVGADIVADLSKEEGADLLYTSALKLLDGKAPDALVNNAALFALDETDVMSLNYLAPKRLITLMSERVGVGSVVNILDTRILNHKAVTPYEKSKKALYDYTIESSRSYSGILRVNGVAPGPVLVPVSVHESAGITPFGRPKPSDVAEAVAFLLNSTVISGCIIPIDGGQSTVFSES